MSEPVRLDVWTDFLCPWCFVGARRVEQVVHEYGDAVEVRWHAFLLQPEPTPKPIEKFRRYTERWVAEGGPASADPDAGFRVWGDEPPPSHSLPPAIAGKAAASFGAEAFDRFHLALMRAYFCDHRDISARATVLDVASESGIDRDEFADRLREHGAAYHQAVVDDHNEAIERGIHAVPTVLINDVLPLPGAQDLETYRRMLDRIRSRD